MDNESTWGGAPSTQREEGGAIFWGDPEWDAFARMPTPAGPQGEFPGANILYGAAPKDVLERLLNGDPLNLAPMCLARLKERAILWLPEHILSLAMACVARDAWEYRGQPELSIWLRQRIDKSIHIALTKAHTDEQNGVPAVESDLPLLDLLVEGFGIHPSRTRLALLHFHSLDPILRRTFQAIFVDGHTFEAYAASGAGTVAQLEDQIVYTAEFMVTFGDPECPDPLLGVV